jgi:hypothetical protein
MRYVILTRACVDQFWLIMFGLIGAAFGIKVRGNDTGALHHLTAGGLSSSADFASQSILDKLFLNVMAGRVPRF